MYVSKMSFKKSFKTNTILFYSFVIILQTSKYHYFRKFLTDRPEQTDQRSSLIGSVLFSIHFHVVEAFHYV